MHYLARAIEDQKRLEEAEKLYIETIDLKRRALGGDHLETLKSMSDLANVYSNQGKLREAEALPLETLAIQRRVLGPEHTHISVDIGL